VSIIDRHRNTTSINIISDSSKQHKMHSEVSAEALVSANISFEDRRISHNFADVPKKPVYEVVAKAFRNSPVRY
jgi:hypothetical protein